jgi:hypothetical protein
VLASEVEISDHVTFRGKEWDVTDVVHLDKGEQIHLELTHWTENNEEVTERFVLDPSTSSRAMRTNSRATSPSSRLGGQLPLILSRPPSLPERDVAATDHRVVDPLPSSRSAMVRS